MNDKYWILTTRLYSPFGVTQGFGFKVAIDGNTAVVATAINDGKLSPRIDVTLPPIAYTNGAFFMNSLYLRVRHQQRILEEYSQAYGPHIH